MRKTKIAEISIITFLIWVGCLLFSAIYYEDNDDVTMNFIAAGAYGEPSQYLVYSGILFGYLLKFLYFLLPTVNCYLWTYLVLNLISVILILIVITDNMPYLPTAILSVLFNILLAKDLYISIQFTKNAVLYTVVGFAVFTWALSKEKPNVFYIIISALFLAVGLNCRYESFLMVVPFGLIAIALVLLLSKPNSRKKALYLIAPIVAVGIILVTNFAAFFLNSEWKDFYVWDNIMMQKRDYGNYHFYWNQEEYEAAGFTEWDFRLLDNWIYSDTDVFSPDMIRKIPAIGKDTRVSDVRFGWDIVSDTFKEIQFDLANYDIPYAFFALLLLAIGLCLFYKLHFQLVAVLLYAITAYGELYWIMNVRRPMWRAEFGVWFTPLVLLACLIPQLPKPELKSSTQKKIIGIALAMVSGFLLFTWQKDYLDYNQKSYLRVRESDQVQYDEMYTLANSDGYFVVSVTKSLGLCSARNIYDIDKKYEGWYKNIVFDGGWTIPSPIGLYYFRQAGMPNPFKALIERDDVYYVGDGERMGYIYQFLNEKYGPGIDVRNVEINGITVWQFYRVQ